MRTTTMIPYGSSVSNGIGILGVSRGQLGTVIVNRMGVCRGEGLDVSRR